MIRESDVRPGQEIMSGVHTGTVSRVARTRWRKRLVRFWVTWDHADWHEAGHMPGDAAYLTERTWLP